MVKQVHKHAKVLAVGVSCAGLAAGAGAIATAGAATTHSGSHARAHARAAAVRRLGMHGQPSGPPAVHGQLVVPTKTGFATVTFDRGTIKSVSGQQLVVTEGTPKSTYQTVTLTIPADAVVKLDGKSAALDSLPTGDHVMVVQGPNKTCVLAGSSGSNGGGSQAGPTGQSQQGGRGGRGGQGAPGGQGGQG